MGRSKAVEVYRQLLKTVNKTFSGDTRAVRQSSTEIRRHFEVSRNLSDPGEIAQKIADAEEARDFLRESVVQARKSSCGTYEVTQEKADQIKGAAPDIVTDNRNK